MSKPLPEIAYLRECFTYDPETGVLTWKTRPLHHFTAASRLWSAEHVQRRWNSRYAGRVAGKRLKIHLRVAVDDRRFLVHRIVWAMQTGQWPTEIDHKNRNGSDNRWENLREATRQQNEWNQYHPKRDLPRGVKASGKRFHAMITIDYKPIFIGAFDTAEEAHEAWCAVARKQRGDFFRAD